MSPPAGNPNDKRPCYVSTWFGPVAFFGAANAAWFHFYAVNGSRTEWVDILLDYCHHKRSQYSPMRSEVFAQGLLRTLRVIPK